MNTPLPPMHWHCADGDVHVATADGEYAGFVAAAARGIEAQDARGTSLGTHPSVALAQRAVATAWTPGTRSPRHATSSSRPHVHAAHVGVAQPVAQAASTNKGKTRWPLAP